MKISLPELVNSKWRIVNRKERSIHYLPFTIHRKTRGFTLIELLVVIGILTVLLAIVLIAINPSKQFAAANNTQRRSDVNAILNAIHQYAADNKGTLPTGISTSESTICKPVATCASPSPALDLCSALTPTYLADLPRDPKDGTTSSGNVSCATGIDYNTKYTVVSTGSGGGNRVTVKAPSAEQDNPPSPTPIIQVTR